LVESVTNLEAGGSALILAMTAAIEPILSPAG
jgi:hypothetical protein